LNRLVKARIQHADFSPITAAEINTVKEAVKKRVVAAIGSNQGIGSIFTNQDDNSGVRVSRLHWPEIHFQFFDFPNSSATTRPTLRAVGGLSIGPAPTQPIDVCATPRQQP
jgi:hypothetical protein